jgi:hypothetical protein
MPVMLAVDQLNKLTGTVQIEEGPALDAERRHRTIGRQLAGGRIDFRPVLWRRRPLRSLTRPSNTCRNEVGNENPLIGLSRFPLIGRSGVLFIEGHGIPLT